MVGARKSNDRVPMQVSPEFHKKLKEIRRKAISGGDEITLRQITEELVKSGILNDFEKKLLKKEIMSIKFDMRLK